MTRRDDARGRGQWQGMNFVRQDLRLAIYLRDGLACVWCGQAIEDGIQLTLDHVQPHSQGGSNSAANLVCACHRCNSVRRDRSAAAFAEDCARYVDGGITAESILSDIATRTAQDIRPFRAEAKTLIARRGSAAKALAALGQE